MVKTKKIVNTQERRYSKRLASQPKPVPVEAKKGVKKAKVKKAKQENGNTKTEEPKAEVTDAK